MAALMASSSAFLSTVNPSKSPRRPGQYFNTASENLSSGSFSESFRQARRPFFLEARAQAIKNQRDQMTILRCAIHKAKTRDFNWIAVIRDRDVLRFKIEDGFLFLVVNDKIERNLFGLHRHAGSWDGGGLGGLGRGKVGAESDGQREKQAPRGLTPQDLGWAGARTI